jgi:hypothetical protein
MIVRLRGVRALSSNERSGKSCRRDVCSGLLRLLPRSWRQTQHAAGDTEAIGDAFIYREVFDQSSAVHDGSHVVGLDLSHARDSQGAQPTVLLGQREDCAHVVSRARRNELRSLGQ